MFSTARGSCFVLVAFLVAMLAGCATTPPPPPETRTIEYGIPEFSYEADAKPVQKKEGITISLVPVSYTTERKIKIEDGQMRPPPFEIFKDPNKEIIGVFDRAEIPYYVIVPSNLQFALKITNQLDHTLRMAGSVVSYNVDGKIVNVPQENYIEFINSIIPRGQEKETSISGPPISVLKDSGVILITVDDVPTVLDKASKVEKTSNFEWVLTYKMKKESKTETIKITEMERYQPR